MPAFDAVIENSTNTLHLELVRASVVAGNGLHIGLENKNFYIKKDRPLQPHSKKSAESGFYFM